MCQKQIDYISIIESNRLRKWYDANKPNKLEKISAFGFLYSEVNTLFIIMYVGVISELSNTYLYALIYTTAFWLALRVLAEKRSRNEVRQHFKEIERNCTKVSRTKLHHVWDIVDSIKSKFRISKNITILYENASHSIPMTHEDETDVYLVLPRNFVVLCKSKSEMARSVIAHEFAHIKHRDTELWFYGEAREFWWWLEVFLITPMWLSFVRAINEIRNLDSGELILAYSWPLILVFWHSNRLRSMRKKSELRADVASVLYTNSTIILEFLKGRYIASSENANHPHPEERISNINNIRHGKIQ